MGGASKLNEYGLKKNILLILKEKMNYRLRKKHNAYSD